MTTISTPIWKPAPPLPATVRTRLESFTTTQAQLLYNRDLTELTAAQRFLAPSYDEALHDPFLLSGMQDAVETITDAIAAGAKLTVHGDYDADGITSTVVLYEALKGLGADVDWFVPDRYGEGYGVALETLQRLQQNGTDLVITVDCGISNAESIAAARAEGLQVIVTDHHTPPEVLPEAEAVINPQLPGDAYPDKGLTGVGVAFKVVQALYADRDDAEARTKWLLDLVAIGTIADLGSLQGENRSLVRYGLLVARQARRPGLQTLATTGGVELRNLTAENIGYAIAPRLNAAGRMAHAREAVALLLADREYAGRLAQDLERLNANRQRATVQATLEARQQFDTDQPSAAIVVAGPWLHGIVGLIAGRLANEFERPALVLERGDVLCKGSARSVEGFNITAALAAQADLLESYGGHPGAAGFSLRTENLEPFTARFTAYCEQQDWQVREVCPEAILQPPDLHSLELADFLEQLGPFGSDNSQPHFVLAGAIIAEVKVIGQTKKHLRIVFEVGGKSVGSVAFGLAHRAAELHIGSQVDALVRIGSSVFNGRRLEVYVDNFRPH